MGLHGKIMNLQVEKRKQNVAIDEALKSHKNLRDIMVAIYTRAHRDARHAAAEIAAEQSFAPDSSKAGDSSLPESVKVENALPAVSG